jgi:hypothetical protein
MMFQLQDCSPGAALSWASAFLLPYHNLYLSKQASQAHWKMAAHHKAPCKWCTEMHVMHQEAPSLYTLLGL